MKTQPHDVKHHAVFSFAATVLQTALATIPLRLLYNQGIKSSLRFVLSTMRSYQGAHELQPAEVMFTSTYHQFDVALEQLKQLKSSQNLCPELFINLLQVSARDKDWNRHASLLKDWQAYEYSNGTFQQMHPEYIAQVIQGRFHLDGGDAARQALFELCQSRSDALNPPESASNPYMMLISLFIQHGDVKSAIQIYNTWLKLPREKFPVPNKTTAISALISPFLAILMFLLDFNPTLLLLAVQTSR